MPSREICGLDVNCEELRQRLHFKYSQSIISNFHLKQLWFGCRGVALQILHVLVEVTWKLHFLESTDSSLGLPEGRLEPGPLSSPHVPPLYSQIQFSSELGYVIHRGDFPLITGDTRLTGPHFSNISHPTKTQKQGWLKYFKSAFIASSSRRLKRCLSVSSHPKSAVTWEFRDNTA